MTLLPNSMSTIELFAVLIFLLMSYVLFGSVLNVLPGKTPLKGFILIVLVDTLTLLTTPLPAIFSSSLKSISISSFTLILDLSMSFVNKTKLSPDMLSTWNLEAVL